MVNSLQKFPTLSYNFQVAQTFIKLFFFFFFQKSNTCSTGNDFEFLILNINDFRIGDNSLIESGIKMESLMTIQVLLICLNENCDCVLPACSTDSFELVLLRLSSVGHILVPPAPSCTFCFE